MNMFKIYFTSYFPMALAIRDATVLSREHRIAGGNGMGMGMGIGIRSGVELGLVRRPGEGLYGSGLRKRRCRCLRLIVVQGINQHIFIIKHG